MIINAEKNRVELTFMELRQLHEQINHITDSLLSKKSALEQLNALQSMRDILNLPKAPDRIPAGL